MLPTVVTPVEPMPGVPPVVPGRCRRRARGRTAGRRARVRHRHRHLRIRSRRRRGTTSALSGPPPKRPAHSTAQATGKDQQIAGPHGGVLRNSVFNRRIAVRLKRVALSRLRFGGLWPPSRRWHGRPVTGPSSAGRSRTSAGAGIRPVLDGLRSSICSAASAAARIPLSNVKRGGTFPGLAPFAILRQHVGQIGVGLGLGIGAFEEVQRFLKPAFAFPGPEQDY